MANQQPSGGDFTNGWQSYYVGPQVAVTTGVSTAKPETASKYVPATLAEDGTWTASAPIGRNHTQLFVRACEGAVCSYETVPLA